MNLIKFKDTVVTNSSWSDVDWYNENLRGKYAYWIRCHYVVPLESIKPEMYVDFETTINNLLGYVYYVRTPENDGYVYKNVSDQDLSLNEKRSAVLVTEVPTDPDQSSPAYVKVDHSVIKYIDLWDDTYEKALHWAYWYIDQTETDNVNSVDKYKTYNSYVPSGDLTRDDLKQFRTWLATSMLNMDYTFYEYIQPTPSTESGWYITIDKEPEFPNRAVVSPDPTPTIPEDAIEMKTEGDLIIARDVKLSKGVYSCLFYGPNYTCYGAPLMRDGVEFEDPISVPTTDFEFELSDDGYSFELNVKSYGEKSYDIILDPATSKIKITESVHYKELIDPSLDILQTAVEYPDLDAAFAEKEPPVYVKVKNLDIVDWDDDTTHMLTYYAGGMYDDTLKWINAFGKTVVDLSGTTTGCKCGCNTNISSLYSDGLSVCDPVSIYRAGIKALMVSVFSDSTTWTKLPSTYLLLVKEYIDGIIQANFGLDVADTSHYYGCECLNKSGQDSAMTILKQLSMVFEYLAKGEVSGHKNFINTVLGEWSKELYELMEWK